MVPGLIGLIACLIVGSLLRVAYSQNQLAKASENQQILLNNIQTQVWYLSNPETYGVANLSHANFVGVPLAKLVLKKYDRGHPTRNSQ